LIDFSASPANQNPGARGMHIDSGFFRSAFNLNARNAGVKKGFFDKLFDLKIFMQKIRIFLLGIPPRLPCFVNPQTETDRIDFLSQTNPPSYYSMIADC
jgi:hypothetical protein